MSTQPVQGDSRRYQTLSTVSLGAVGIFDHYKTHQCNTFLFFLRKNYCENDKFCRYEQLNHRVNWNTFQSHFFLYSIVLSLSSLNLVLNLLTLVGFIVTGWRLMLTDTINHCTDKQDKTGQTFLQVRLRHGLERLRKTENRPWYELYLDHGKLSQSSKCLWRNLSPRSGIAEMPGIPVSFTSYYASSRRSPSQPVRTWNFDHQSWILLHQNMKLFHSQFPGKHSS